MTSPGSIDADTDLASLQRLEPIASTSQFTLEAPQRAHYARTSLARPVLLDTVSRAGSSTSATASDVTGMPHLPSAAALASRKSSGPTRYVRSASITSLKSLEEAGRLTLRRQASTTAVTLTEEPSSVDDETADATPPAKGLLDWVAGTGLTRKRDADSPTPSASALNPADWLPSLFSAKHLPESEGKEEKETDKYLEDEDRAKKGDLPWQRVKDHYEKPRLPIVFCHVRLPVLTCRRIDRIIHRVSSASLTLAFKACRRCRSRTGEASRPLLSRLAARCSSPRCRRQPVRSRLVDCRLELSHYAQASKSEPKSSVPPSNASCPVGKST